MQASAPAFAETAPKIGASQRRRAIIATVIGNALEWFDFTVYSFFAVIIAKLFFPTGNDLSSLLLAVATFGVGFFIPMMARYIGRVWNLTARGLTTDKFDMGYEIPRTRRLEPKLTETGG